MGADPARAPTARCCSRCIHELIARGLYDRDFVDALHQRAAAGEPATEPSDEFGLFADAIRRGRRRSTPTIRTTSSGGTRRGAIMAACPTHRRRRRSGARRARTCCPTARRVKPAFQLLARSRARVHARVGGGDHRHSARRHRAARARDGRRPRATRRSSCRSRGPTAWGGEHADGDRQSGRVPRDARPRRASQRLPDDPRAGDPDVAARHDRPPRRLPPQGAVPARDSAERASRRSRRTTSSRTRRSTRAPLGFPAERPTTCSSTTTASRCASTRRFSWEYPLSAHGLMHNVITNAGAATRTGSTRC